MIVKKYKLIETDTKVRFGHTLFRIQANVSFGGVAQGDLGGYIEKESNLAIEVSGDAWVSGDARVFGNARVSGDAWVFGDARVSLSARVLTGYITKKLSLRYSLMAQVGISFEKKSDKLILYKSVKRLTDVTFASVYDGSFKYEIGKVAKVADYDKSDASCARGLHLAGALYWDKGDTLLACEFKASDIITVQEGKVRVKACKPLWAITKDKM